MLSPFSQISFTAVLVLIFTGARLDAKSVIVDDTDASKITYSSGWLVGNTCTGCFAQPDKTQAFNGTWHDATASGATDLFFTFTFTGISVEARYTAIDIIQTAFVFTTGTNVSYTIDGVQRGTSVRNPANLNSYAYNQLLFNVPGLENVEHTLRVDLLKPSVLLLDYLVYDDGSAVTSSITTSTASSTSSTVSSTPSDTSSTPNTNSGAIIGGVVAAVVVFVLGSVLIWYYLKRRRNRQTSAMPTLGPENDAMPPSKYLSPSAQPVAATTQIGQTFNPQHPTSSLTATHTSSATRSDRSGAPLTGMNRIHAPSDSLTSSTIPPSSSEIKYLSSLPSVTNSPGVPRQPPQGVTTGGVPPSSFYTNVVGNLVQAQIPDEPVEEGLMSRQMSMTSTLPPPYSPGGR